MSQSMMKKCPTIVIAVMLWCLLLASSANCETVEVQIIKSAFIPAVVTIKQGDTVRWLNMDGLLHTVTSGKAPLPDDKFNAPFVLKKFDTKFEKVGFIDYFCAIHNVTMRGVIIVEEKK